MARKGLAGLTQKQARFVEEYLIDLNSTQAAIRAGYSPKTARSQGSTLLTNPNVQAYIERRRQEQQTRSQISTDWVIQQLVDIATANGADYSTVDERGAMRYTPTDKLSKSQRGAIAGIRPTTAGPQVQLYDRMRALELIGRHLGMWDRVPASQGQDIEDLAPLADLLTSSPSASHSAAGTDSDGQDEDGETT